MIKRLFLDTETTSSDQYKAGMWQLGGIIECGKRKEEFLFECDIFEGDDIESETLAKINITLEKIATFANPFEVYNKFVKLLDKYIDCYDKKDKFHVIAYSAHFDQAVLRTWFERNGDKFFGAWFWHPWIDVMVLGAQKYIDKRQTMNNFKFSTFAQFLGIEVNEAEHHTALYDAQKCREMYWKIVAEDKN